MLCYHQNTKLRIVTFGPTTSSFLMMTKHMSYLKENLGKKLCKNFPSNYASYQVQDINKLHDKGIVLERDQTNTNKYS